MYSEPLGIHKMSFRSFPTSHNPYWHFQSLLAYIRLVSTLMDYLCIPHTIVYLSDVFLTLSDLFQSLFIFALIEVPMFWLLLIVDRFHWLQCYYMFGLRSLRTISHIWTIRCHFDPSNVTITYTSPTTPILKREKNFALRSQDLVRLCITSIWLRLCSPAFLDLVPCTLTLTHCILPCYTVFSWLFFIFSLHFVSFALISIDLSFSTADCVLQTPTLFNIPLSDLYWAGYHPHITLFTSHICHRNWFTRTFTTFRSFQFPAASYTHSQKK